MQHHRRRLKELSSKAGREAASALSLALEAADVLGRFGPDSIQFEVRRHRTRYGKRPPHGKVYVTHVLQSDLSRTAVYRHKLVLPSEAYDAYIALRDYTFSQAKTAEDFAAFARELSTLLAEATRARLADGYDSPARVKAFNEALSEAQSRELKLVANS